MAGLSRSTTSVWIWNYSEDYAYYYPAKYTTLRLCVQRVHTYTNRMKKYVFSIHIEEPNGHFQTSNIKKFKAKNMEQAIRFVEKLIYKTYIVSIIWDQVKYNEQAYMDDDEYKTIDKSI